MTGKKFNAFHKAKFCCLRYKLSVFIQNVRVVLTFSCLFYYWLLLLFFFSRVFCYKEKHTKSKCYLTSTLFSYLKKYRIFVILSNIHTQCSRVNTNKFHFQYPCDLKSLFLDHKSPQKGQHNVLFPPITFTQNLE